MGRLIRFDEILLFGINRYEYLRGIRDGAHSGDELETIGIAISRLGIAWRTILMKV